MAQTEKPKRSPKAKAVPKTTDKEQSERFIAAARDLGIESARGEFDRAVAKIVKKRN